MPEQRFVPKRTPKPVPGAHSLGSRITNEFEVAKRNGKPLSPEHPSRLVRIAKATAAAVAYFEKDKDAAKRWVTSPKVAPGGETPLALASTPEGSDDVLELLERMEHGVVS